MATNTNSKTGLGYGVINANAVSSEALDWPGDWVDIDEANYIDGVKKKLLGWLNEDGEDAFEAAKTVDMEHDDDFVDELTFLFEEGPANGALFGEGDLEHVMQHIYDSLDGGDNDTWEYDDGEYHLLLDTNENVLWVMDSPWVADVNRTFWMTYPNCGNLDEPSEYKEYFHALGPEFFDEYSPCPYVPVKLSEVMG